MGNSEDEGDATEANGFICPLCQREISRLSLLITKCGHNFHRECIAIHARTKTSCPTCKAVCFENPAPKGSVAANTRQQSQLLSSPANLNQAESAPSATSIQMAVSQAVLSMQDNILIRLSEQMVQIIEANITSKIQPLIEAQCQPSQVQSPHDVHMNFNQPRLASRSTLSQDLQHRPETGNSVSAEAQTASVLTILYTG